MDGRIYIGIASYRDIDLARTVQSAYDRAVNKDKLYFSVFSQDSRQERVDLSFIPEHQLNYICVPYQEARGTCYARYIANSGLSKEFKYFLQIDSHTRFVYGWDLLITNCFEEARKNKWGSRFILTAPGSTFEVEWNEEGTDYKEVNFNRYVITHKPVWNEDEHMVCSALTDYTGDSYGQEMFYVSAHFMFCLAETMLEIPYDSLLYFWGEEITLAVRAYTRGIKLVAPPISILFTNLNRESSRRPLHWSDDAAAYTSLDLSSKSRAGSILSGEQGFGVYGIDSRVLYEEYQSKTGIDLVNQSYLV